MFTRFKRRYKSIFLDPLSSVAPTKEKVNVLLSPSLYWVKKLSLTLKNERDIKKLLPSLFEETLPEGNYSYSFYKSGEYFYVFAYEDKKILDVLSQKGVALSHVAGLYFAQSELQNMPLAVQINKVQSMYVQDGILVLVPSSWTQGSASLDLSAHEPSKYSITLKQFGHVVDSKSLVKIGTILLVFCLVLAAEYFITSYKVAKIDALKKELFTSYNLKSTMMQNSAMLKKYDAIYTSQIKLREYIAHILSLNLGAKEELVKLSVKNNLLHAEFSGVQEGKEEHILKMLREKKVNFKASFKESSWHVELSL